MRIALAQINPTVGDIRGNAQQIGQALADARAAGAALAVFPELSVIGYPPKDLLLKPAVVEECAQAIAALASDCIGIAAIIGYPAASASPRGRSLCNAAAFCHEGRVASTHVKSLLPTYDVFDERRYFEPGPRVDVTHFGDIRLGVSICEDLWNERDVVSRQLYHDNPIDELAALGVGLFINSSASPFVARKHAFRLKLMAAAAKRHGIPLLYVNQVGGNDELVFDGNSCAFDANGKLIAQAKDFETDLLIVDVQPRRDLTGAAGDKPAHSPAQKRPIAVPAAGSPAAVATTSAASQTNRLETPKAGCEAIYHALVLGLRDYCRKCGFKSIVLGLSGGIDSALCAVLAAAALGPENVRGISMPSRYSSDGSVSDAEDLARRLGLHYHTIPIEGPHLAFEQAIEPHFAGMKRDTTEENVQARVRGVVLMSFSNKFGSLLVTTGNKSELAVGYCTLYGDMAGGLAVISDVPKTLVWELSKWINESPASPMRVKYGGPVIPDASITKAPSAELRPNQTDQDSLPPYEVLDQIVERYVEREESAGDICAALPDVDQKVILKMVRLIDFNEYKRKQAAPGLKVTGRAFGFGRRMPIAQRYDSSRSLGTQGGAAAAAPPAPAPIAAAKP
ncbi:MAG: NAD+ synthase [Planctomycetota bacterium]|nr:NAD+ synthase [Planctomycetota bacterium]